MADDIRENAMSGGTPARLRGLAANGNSISPTLEEVMNAMGIHTYSFTLASMRKKTLVTWDTECISLRLRHLESLLLLSVVPIRIVLYQMEEKDVIVITRMEVSLLFSDEKN